MSGHKKSYTIHSPAGMQTFRKGTNPMYVERAFLQTVWSVAPDSKLAHDVAMMELHMRPLAEVSVDLGDDRSIYIEVE